MGIRAHAFNPLYPDPVRLLNNRDHRKLIIDGGAAFTGASTGDYINEYERRSLKTAARRCGR